MRGKEEQRFRRIDVGDLSGMVNSQYLNNFYLSYDTLKDIFFEKGSSFIFNGFSITLCKKGYCSMKVSGRDYTAEKDSLVILSPNQFVEITDMSDDFTPVSIIVSLDVILEFPSPVDMDIMYNVPRHPVIGLSPGKLAHFMEYYDFIEKQYNETDNAYREEISKALLYALMLEICDVFRSVTGDDKDIARPKPEQLTDDFFKLLARHYKTEHNIGFYADMLNRTPKYLSGAIKRLSGRSVSDWINSTLISEIKLRLKVTDKTVLEISEELNFSSPSVFVQFFRHHTGITPLQYRKQG